MAKPKLLVQLLDFSSGDTEIYEGNTLLAETSGDDKTVDWLRKNRDPKERVRLKRSYSPGHEDTIIDKLEPKWGLWG